jgi:ribosome-associated toxin RatA of RatAB toxin-antitoxin module
VFELVLDVASFPRLMPNVNRVDVLDDQGETRLTRWDTEIEGAPLVWTERDTIVRSRLRIEFEAVEGDFEVFRGAWEVLPRDGGAEVACELEYALGIPTLEELVGPVLKAKIAENLDLMLTGLVRGVEVG